MAGSDDKNREGEDSPEFSPPGDYEHDGESAGEPLETERLALDEDNERLPWLDSDDEGDGEVADGGRILGLVLLGLIALAVIVGGIWWSTNRKPDAALVADGSTIAAPPGDYKQAPKDPGGKTFEGTGNTAFAVSEGQNRPAKLGESTALPPVTSVAKPGFDIGSAVAESMVPPPVVKAGTPPVAAAKAGPLAAAPPKAAALPKAAAPPAAPKAAPPPVSGGPVVQVGAYSSRTSAEAAWGRLSQQYSALSGVRHQVVEGTADIGTVFRLQALPGDGAAAQSLCGRLKSAGLACQVK